MRSFLGSFLCVCTIVSSFVPHDKPPSPTDYVRQLEHGTARRKMQSFRRQRSNFTREWEADFRLRQQQQRRRALVHSRIVSPDGTFPTLHTNGTSSEEQGNAWIRVQIPQRVFVPLSEMASQLGNLTSEGYRSARSSNPQQSESGQFRLEQISNDTNFSMVGGYLDIKQELLQILDFIREPEKYRPYGVRMVKGILLEGSPGNGKTLIARCLAGEANMNFVVCSGAEFSEKYVGVGASRVREMFDFVRRNQPCILFIDEIDALARKRTEVGEMSHQERDSTLNQLLVLMDGFHQHDTILVIGATNRADMLDRAILRPGRFDKIIHIPNPDMDTRREILAIHSTRKPLNVSNEDLVRLTNGLSGAQIENLLNEATLMAIRADDLPVQLKQVEYVKERMLLGQTSNYRRNVTETTLRRIAVHEVGHLMLALQSEHYERPWKITVDSVNPKHSLGYTIFETNEEDEGLFIREYLEDKIKVLLGGRVAEEVVYGQSVSSGALADLGRAFDVAKTMIMDYGMGTSPIYPYMSETFKRRIDEQIHQLLTRMYKDTKAYILTNRELMEVFVDQLLAKKTMTAEEIEEVYMTYLYFPTFYREVTKANQTAISNMFRATAIN